MTSTPPSRATSPRASSSRSPRSSPRPRTTPSPHKSPARSFSISGNPRSAAILSQIILPDSPQQLRRSASDDSLAANHKRSSPSFSDPPKAFDPLFHAARAKLSSIDQEAMRKLRSTMLDQTKSSGTPFPAAQIFPRASTSKSVNSPDHTIAVIGHSGVGKTTVIERALKSWGATSPVIFQTPQGHPGERRRLSCSGIYKLIHMMYSFFMFLDNSTRGKTQACVESRIL